MANIVYPPGCREISEDLGADELVRRLKTLSHTYQSMTQDDGAAQELVPLARHLADDFFCEHPSKDVQLLVACCIADVLRVYAPNAPYTDPAQVKSIFMFIIKQLNGLKDPKDPAFKRYFYLLENLAYVKSFNMCLELEDSNEVICALFTLMLKIVNDEHSSKVKSFMLDVLCPLIHESDVVSNELLNTILINIVEPAKSTRKNAYYLAKELVMKCSDTLEPYIQAFFNHVLILGKEEKSLAISRKVYDLIYGLNHICPTVLLAVVPQLEFKLKSTDENERYEAVSLLARMFSEPDSNLALHHRQLWLAFRGRFNDISMKIRTKCVQYSMHFLLNHPELRADITETLKLRQHDPDEAVRYEVVMAIVSTAKRDFSIVSDSEDLLNFVKERTLDKKFKIRKEAMCGLAMIYRKYLSNPDVPDATRHAVTWIKDKILHAYYMKSTDDRLLVERIFNTCLVPFTLPSDERMRKLYYMYTTLDENAIKAFIEMQKQQMAVRRTLQELLELTRAAPSEERERERALRITHLARFLPNPVKAQEFIRKLAANLCEDEGLLGVLETVVSSSTSCRHSVDSVNRLLKRLGAPVMTNLYYNTVKLLLERVTSVMVDREALLALLSLVEQTVEDPSVPARLLDISPDVAVDRGLRLLYVLSFVQSAQFCDEQVLGRLVQMAAGRRDQQVTPIVLAVLHLVGSGRQLWSRFELLGSQLVPLCRELVTGGTPRQAKHAVRCLVVHCDPDRLQSLFAEIIETLKSQMEPGNPQLRTSVVALGHIALNLADKFPVQLKNIVSRKIVKELLMKDIESESGAVQEEDESGCSDWCDINSLSEGIRCKLEGLKLMARWLVGLRDDVISAQKTFRMLVAFIVHRGDLLAQGKVSKAEAAWLRLAAGCSMLKICEQKGVGDQFTAEQFYSLSQLMVDECLEVRQRFAAKLHRGLNRGIPQKCLPLDFMGLYALAGAETDKRLRALVRQYIASDIAKRREVIKSLMLTGGAERASDQLPHIMPDYMLVFAVPVLAHDPEFVEFDDIQYLTRLRTCLWFILEPLITKNDNYSFGFYKALVEGMKNHHDAVRCDDDVTNKKLWAICDLAMGLLLTKTTNFEMRVFPSEPRIPPMYFRKRAEPGFVNSKIYLPAELQSLHKRCGAAGVGAFNKRVQLSARCQRGGGRVSEAGGRPTSSEAGDDQTPPATVEEEDDQQLLVREPPATYSRRSAHDREPSEEADAAFVLERPEQEEISAEVKQDKITSYFQKSGNGAASEDGDDVDQSQNAEGATSTNRRSTRRNDNSADQSQEGADSPSTNQRSTRRNDNSADQSKEGADSPSTNQRSTCRNGTGDSTNDKPRIKAPPKLIASPFAVATRQRSALSATSVNGSSPASEAGRGKRKVQETVEPAAGCRKSSRRAVTAPSTDNPSTATRNKRSVRGTSK